MAYGVLVWLVCAAFVRWYEEPTLRRRYGEQDESYRASVTWLPRRPRGPVSAQATGRRDRR